MSEYYRDSDRERRRRNSMDDDDQSAFEEVRDDVKGWFRDQERDWDRNRDQTRQWQSERDFEQGRGRGYDRNTFGDRYGQNYNRGWGGEGRDWEYRRDHGRDYDRGQYRNRQSDFGRGQDWDQDSNRYSEDYGRGYNRGRMRTDFDDYDYDFDTGYDRRFRDQERGRGQEQYGLGEDYDREYRRNYGYGRAQNRSQVSYGRGYQGEFDRRGEQNRGDRDQWYGRGRQYGTGGMRSDYEGESSRNQYPTAGMRSDYGRGRDYRDDFYNEEDFDYRSGYVGYDREGAFYQDLDEPYSYEYWEMWMVPGEFTGMGPQNYQRSDERVHEEVCERLTRHGRIDASDIEINVKDGEVIMTGAVTDREMKRLAEYTIESIPGVKNVRNEIHVIKQDRPEQRDWTSRVRETGQPETGTSSGMTSNMGSTMTGQAATGETRMGDDKRRQLREGMEVIGKNGKIVGRVKEVRGSDFLVDREMARDVYVPFNAVKTIGSQAQLEVAAEEVDNQGWEKPDAL